MKTEFTELFFNGISPATFIFSFLCFVVGFGIFHSITVTKAVKKAPYSPDKFNFWYWLNDNFSDMVMFMAVSYLTIRFTPEILSIAGAGNLLADYSGSPFAFVLMGFAYEKINKAIRKFAAKK